MAELLHSTVDHRKFMSVARIWLGRILGEIIAFINRRRLYGIFNSSCALYGVLGSEQSDEFRGASTLGTLSYWCRDISLILHKNETREENHSDTLRLCVRY